MHTRDFEACVALQAEATLLLAQAALRQGLAPVLPEEVDVWLVHARGDEIVPCEERRVGAPRGRSMSGIPRVMSNPEGPSG